MNTVDDKVFTVDDVRNHLHIGKNTAYNLFLKDKTFPSFKIGKRHLVLETQYLKWLEKQSNKSKYAIRY